MRKIRLRMMFFLVLILSGMSGYGESLDEIYGSFRPRSIKMTPWSEIFPQLNMCIELDESMLYSTQALMFGSIQDRLSKYFDVVSGFDVSTKYYTLKMRQRDAKLFKTMADSLNLKIMRAIKKSGFDSADYEKIKEDFKEEMLSYVKQKRFTEYFFSIYKHVFDVPGLLDMILDGAYGYVLVAFPEGTETNRMRYGGSYYVSGTGTWDENTGESFGCLVNSGDAVRWYPWVYISNDSPITVKNSFVAGYYYYPESILYIKHGNNYCYTDIKHEELVIGGLMILEGDNDKFYSPLSPTNYSSATTKKIDTKEINLTMKKLDNSYYEISPGKNLGFFYGFCKEEDFKTITNREFSYGKKTNENATNFVTHGDIKISSPKKLLRASNPYLQPTCEDVLVFSVTTPKGFVPSITGMKYVKNDVRLIAYKLTENDGVEMYPLLPANSWVERFKNFSILTADWLKKYNKVELKKSAN